METEQYTNLMNKLSEMHGDFREFKGSVDEKVKRLEEDARSDRKWSKVQTIIVIPVMAGLHQIANHLGWLK